MCRGAKPLCRESEGARQMPFVTPFPSERVRGMVEKVFEYPPSYYRAQPETHEEC